MNYLIFIGLILFGFGFAVLAQKSDTVELLCANEDCSESLAEIVVKQSLPSVDRSWKIPVNKGERGIAYAKPATKDGYWMVEMNGRTGYVRSNLISPIKTFKEPVVTVIRTVEPSPSEVINPSTRLVEVRGTMVPADAVPPDQVPDNLTNTTDNSSNPPEGSVLPPNETVTSSAGVGQASSQMTEGMENDSIDILTNHTTPENISDNLLQKPLTDQATSGSTTSSVSNASNTSTNTSSNYTIGGSILPSHETVDSSANDPQMTRGMENDPINVNSLTNQTTPENNSGQQLTDQVISGSTISSVSNSLDNDVVAVETDGDDKGMSNQAFGTDNYSETKNEVSDSNQISTSSSHSNSNYDANENVVSDSEKTNSKFDSHSNNEVLNATMDNIAGSQIQLSNSENVSETAMNSNNFASGTPPDSQSETIDSSAQVESEEDTSTTVAPADDNQQLSSGEVSSGKESDVTRDVLRNDFNSDALTSDTSNKKSEELDLDTGNRVGISQKGDDVSPNNVITKSEEKEGDQSQPDESKEYLEMLPSNEKDENLPSKDSMDKPFSNNEPHSDLKSHDSSKPSMFHPGYPLNKNIPEIAKSIEQSTAAHDGISESDKIVYSSTERNSEQQHSFYGLIHGISTSPQPDLSNKEYPSSEETTEVPAVLPDSSSLPFDGSEDLQGGWFSSFGTALEYFENLFTSSQLPETPEEPDLQEVTKPSVVTTETTAQYGYCHDEKCGGLERPITEEDRIGDPNEFPDVCKPFNVVSEKASPLSMKTLIYISITSVVILLFSLGYYYIDSSQNSGSLIAKVNILNQELFVVRKEKDSLEEQLVKVKENFTAMDSSIVKQDSKVALLEDELKECENAKRYLEETVARLEKEVETLMENGMEMHRLLSESISDEERSQMLLANIDELKGSLDARLGEIVSLTEQVDEKNNELQMLNLDLRNAHEKQADLERKLKNSRAEVEDEMTKTIQDLQKQIIKLQELVDEKNESEARQEKELVAVRSERDVMRSRAKSAESGLAAAHGVKAGEAREAWLDVTRLRAEAELTSQNISKMENTVSELTCTNAALLDKISGLHLNLSELNAKYENAEREKVNAFTKLQVLSDYFKEKENKLQEELGVKESQWLQKETEDHTIYEQMKSLRDEISHLKSQNESLKSEILDQERSHKALLQAEEQKLHDHWVALRQTERKYKELQVEAAHYRNRLTQIEASGGSGEKLNPALLEVGGTKGLVGAPSPPFVLLPPPPEPFTLDTMMALRRADRPPPLGRISSPPLGPDLPPPPLVNFDFIPPPSSTPPPPLFHPQPRDRPPKDSPPSNYSSESIGEKTSRRRR